MTRRGKETDQPVFLLKRKRGGVCIVQVTFVKLALLFQLLHYRAPVTEVTNAAPRVEDHNCLLQTSGWVLSSCLHRQKDCAWFAHCQSSSKCKHTTLCSRPTSQWYESCGSPPPRILASTMHSDVSPQLVTGSVRKYRHKDTTWCVCAPLCAIGLPLQHVLELQFPQWWRGVAGVNSLTLFLWECDVNSNMGTQWAIKGLVVLLWLNECFYFISLSVYVFSHST